jgi:hypothetical protein
LQFFYFFLGERRFTNRTPGLANMMKAAAAKACGFVNDAIRERNEAFRREIEAGMRKEKKCIIYGHTAVRNLACTFRWMDLYWPELLGCSWTVDKNEQIVVARGLSHGIPFYPLPSEGEECTELPSLSWDEITSLD